MALSTSDRVNHFSLLEWGAPAFSRDYCELVQTFYDAVSYVPPFGHKNEANFVATLTETIEAAETGKGKRRDLPGASVFH